jgi:hypothetical protein
MFWTRLPSLNALAQISAPRFWILQRAGLRLGTTSTKFLPGIAGTVGQQDPPANSVVARGTTFNLVVVASRGAQNPADGDEEFPGQVPRLYEFLLRLLLDESRLKKETLYQNQKRWMLNRLVLGTGVVCGLGVDPQNSGMILVVQRGVALDGLGREVVVPAPVSVNPFLLTDSSGNPSGTADREKGNFDHSTPAQSLLWPSGRV